MRCDAEVVKVVGGGEGEGVEEGDLLTDSVMNLLVMRDGADPG